jgi:hypothetical protein
MATGSDRYMSDKEKIALLQYLDANSLQSLLGGQDSGYGDALARLEAMGGDASTAAQDFLTDVESGLPYQEVKKQFESAVSKGIYNLDPDTADEVSKSVLTALTNKQKGGGSNSMVKAAKELGFPELAFLAPSMAQKTQTTPNPYSAPSTLAQKYNVDLEGLRSQKLKETGGNSFLRKALKIGGTLVGGAAAGMAAAAAAPISIPIMIGAGVAGAGLGGVTSAGVLDRLSPDSTDLKKRKSAQQQAILDLQNKLTSEQGLQQTRQTAWQKGYEDTIKKSGGMSSPFDIQKLQLMTLLNKQG